MFKPSLRLKRLMLGYGFLGLGVCGFVIPLLQGWFFVALALVLLKKDAAWAQRLFIKLMSIFPKTRPIFHYVDQNLEKILIKLGLETKHKL